MTDPSLSPKRRTHATVLLPWPPVALWPNNARRGHWSRKAEALRAYRLEGKLACSSVKLATGFLGWPLTTPVVMDVTFFAPDRRRRDLANCLSAIKGGIDGIVDGGLLSDDNADVLKVGRLEIVKGEKPGVRIELSSEEAPDA